MSAVRQVAPGECPVTDAELRLLRAAVRGTVHDRSSPGYDDGRALFNTALDHRPGAVVTVASAADVAAVVSIARVRGLSISVRGGGHGVAGRATAGDVVLDLSAVRGVMIDAAHRTATIRGGSRWAELDAAAAAYGLATPGGRVGSTGIAGFTLGGGEGWLSAAHGLSCDNLLAVELVTADGRHVVASRDQEPALFWALRGAGANFGVAVSLTFRLHPIAAQVLGGMLLYRVADAPAVLSVLSDLHEAGDDRFAGAAAIFHAPAAAFVPGNVVGRRVLGVVPAYTGAAERGRGIIEILRAAARPLADSVRPMSYLELQTVFDGTAPAGLRRAWGAQHVSSLTPQLIDDIDAAELPGRDSKIILLRFGGAVSRPVEDTAVALRGPSWLVHPAAQWTGPADDARHRDWVRHIESRVRSAGAVGTYLNLTNDDHSAVHQAFDPDRIRRLAALKTEWDPEDAFRHCAHVAPAGPGASE